MASLGLDVDWSDDGETVRVSWTDIMYRKQNFGIIMLMFGVFIGGALWAIFAIFSEDDLTPLGIWIVACVALLAFLMTKTKDRNLVIIGKEETRHGGQRFPTKEITRFEYGSEQALTGSASLNSVHAGQIDQNIIRMWINDSTAHIISKNAWQNQVNHEIRDALAKALDDMRKGEAEEKREEIHGTAGEYGVPDY